MNSVRSFTTPGPIWCLWKADTCHALLTHAPEKLRSLKNVVSVEPNEEPESSDGGSDRFHVSESNCEIRHVTLHDLNGLLEQTCAAERPEFPEPGPDDPAFILYTSGSTGEPKGAVHCKSDIFYTNETFCREVLRLTPQDRLFSSSRLPFAYGLGNSFSFPLLNGATTILCREKPSPDLIARIFSRSHVPRSFSAFRSSTTFCSNIIGASSKLDCSSLRLCVSAGEALPAHLGEEWEREFGVQLLDGIGSTEMLHMFMSNHENDVRYGSSGRLLKGYEARLLDEHGEPTPDGVEGNLWIKGDSAALWLLGKSRSHCTNFRRRLGSHRRSLSLRQRGLLVSHGTQ